MNAATLENIIRQAIGNEAYVIGEMEDFPTTPAGIYTINVSYVLPGNVMVTTPATTINIEYSGNSGGLGFSGERDNNPNPTSSGNDD